MLHFLSDFRFIFLFPFSMDKGLVNNRGENNCFLNVVIQSLWHLESFRSTFFDWNIHKCDRTNTAACVHCALKV